MYDRFADDPLVRLLEPNEEKTRIEEQIAALDRREAILSMEYSRAIGHIRAERASLVQKLEDGKWND